MVYERGFVDGEYQDGEIRGIVFLCGRRGRGKTTRMNEALEACAGGRVFFDTLSKHADVFPHYKVICEPGALKEYLLLNRNRRFNVLYQPRSGKLDVHFEMACRIIRAIGNCILAIDELDKLCGPQHGASWMPEGLYYLVNYGRHVRVSLIATARRPQQVPRGFTGEAEMWLFNMQDTLALKYLEEMIGRENVARVRTLPKFHYLHVREDEPPSIRNGKQVLRVFEDAPVEIPAPPQKPARALL